MIRNIEELQAIGRENVEAAFASAAALTRGLQSIATEVADFQRKSVEDTAAVWEKALAAKSFEKAVEVQTEFAKGVYEAYLGRANKISEIYLNAAKEALKPFEAQVDKFVGKATAKKAA